MIELCNLSPKELSILANVIALALAEEKTPDQLNVLGNFIVAVGSLLLTIAAQQQSLQNIQDTINQNMQSDQVNK